MPSKGPIPICTDNDLKYIDPTEAHTDFIQHSELNYGTAKLHRGSYWIRTSISICTADSKDKSP